MMAFLHLHKVGLHNDHNFEDQVVSVMSLLSAIQVAIVEFRCIEFNDVTSVPRQKHFLSGLKEGSCTPCMCHLLTFYS
ncbi:hypothetical protein L6164_021145 [Bauhinia variegata]|uniref:Uncharacterized protein n=1 Tax=Bauhinia variegata TaxID=167791 RepID=A0ACB9MZC1_BAUVA|nr:hypothetical protein L6164_021145 [Bauhinia variegata]